MNAFPSNGCGGHGDCGNDHLSAYSGPGHQHGGHARSTPIGGFLFSPPQSQQTTIKHPLKGDNWQGKQPRRLIGGQLLSLGLYNMSPKTCFYISRPYLCIHVCQAYPKTWIIQRFRYSIITILKYTVCVMYLSWLMNQCMVSGYNVVCDSHDAQSTVFVQ